MAKQTLYIMTGLPYAGKTTLTTKLVKRFGFSVTSVDAVIDENGLDVPKMTPKDWNFVYSEAYERLKRLLKEGKNVILDLGNLKRSERNTARNIALSLYVPFKLIYVNTSKDEVFKRWLKNQDTKERGHLAEESFNKALDMFEDLDEEENHIIYNMKMDLTTWIKENIAN
jgi:predicted kinase